MTKMEQAIFGKKGYQPNLPKKKLLVHSPKKKKAALPIKMTSAELKRHLYENMSEEEHQSLLIKWLDEKSIPFETGLEGIFLPNPHPEGSRAFIIQAASNRKVLAKMRAVGMRRGVSDVKIYLKTINLHIELKRCDGGTISPEQRKTHETINSTTYAVHRFCNGFEEAKSFILEHLII